MGFARMSPTCQLDWLISRKAEPGPRGSPLSLRRCSRTKVALASLSRCRTPAFPFGVKDKHQPDRTSGRGLSAHSHWPAPASTTWASLQDSLDSIGCPSRLAKAQDRPEVLGSQGSGNSSSQRPPSCPTCLVVQQLVTECLPSGILSRLSQNTPSLVMLPHSPAELLGSRLVQDSKRKASLEETERSHHGPLSSLSCTEPTPAHHFSRVVLEGQAPSAV